MNKAELENELEEIANFLGCNSEELKSEIMKIIPEVLKSVIPNKGDVFGPYEEDYNICIDHIKQKAKELYGIEL